MNLVTVEILTAACHPIRRDCVHLAFIYPQQSDIKISRVHGSWDQAGTRLSQRNAAQEVNSTRVLYPVNLSDESG